MSEKEKLKEESEKQPIIIRAEDYESEVSEEEIQEIMKKVDKNQPPKLTGYSSQIVYILAVGFSCFQLYTAIFGALAAQLQRSIHLSFAFVLVFLLYPFRTKSASNKLKWHDFLFAAFAGLVGLYLTFNYTRLWKQVETTRPETIS